MRTRRRGAYLLALIMLLTAGCSLARPEASDGEGQGDWFVGVYMVYEAPGGGGFYDNPNLVEYGAYTADLGDLGVHTFPKQVLFADENGRFPGLEGRALYALETEEEWGQCTTVVGDLSGGPFNTTTTDAGTEIDIGGVLYFGPPEDAPADWSTNDIPGIWHAYKVYQGADGRAFLDGSGNTFSGGPTGFTLSEKYASTVNGEAKTDSFSVEVTVEQVPRLEEVCVRQYGADGMLLECRTVALRDEPEAVAWHGDAAWAVVEERDADGVKRSIYDRPEEGEEAVAHSFVLLDEQGLGHEVMLDFEEKAPE